MHTRRDIATRDDIELFVKRFYERAVNDPIIGYLFTEVAKMDLEAHLPTMYAFWESLLLKAHSYNGNVMQQHLKLNQKEALKPEHFARWLELFHQTIDSLFCGPRADEAKHRAGNITKAIQKKLSAAELALSARAPL